MSSPSLDMEALMDPAYCENCHPDHYREWSGSMHAYSSDDPMLLALNARLQADTDGAAGTFCVQCHAPMAVRTGATTDGLNLGELPRHLKGVTCYFCHSVASVEGTHNNPLVLADDGVMLGNVADPMPTEAHESAYSALLDGQSLESSSLCGACHDVVTPAGVLLETTYAEWQESVFAQPGPAGLSCNRCHMPGRDGLSAEVPGAPTRRVYEHAWPGIDAALSPWPGVDEQLAGIARDLQPSLLARLCVNPAAGGTDVEVTLDNIFAGHAWPSGATHARRGWVELVAYAGETIVYSSGLVAEGEPVMGRDDPDLWTMGTKLFDESGAEVHLPWLATSITSTLLPAAVTNDPTDPAYYHAVSRTYSLAGLNPDRVTMVVHMRPVPLDIVDFLIDSEGMAPDVRDLVPTYTLEPTSLEWNVSDGFGCSDD